VRTFHTGFTSDDSFVKYGRGDIMNLFVLGKRMDELQSKIDKHHKDSYLDKKERAKYKNRRTKWRRKWEGFL
jgi:hypothetical protein